MKRDTLWGWSNWRLLSPTNPFMAGACRGYVISAMERCGFDPTDIEQAGEILELKVVCSPARKLKLIWLEPLMTSGHCPAGTAQQWGVLFVALVLCLSLTRDKLSLHINVGKGGVCSGTVITNVLALFICVWYLKMNKSRTAQQMSHFIKLDRRPPGTSDGQPI